MSMLDDFMCIMMCTALCMTEIHSSHLRQDVQWMGSKQDSMNQCVFRIGMRACMCVHLLINLYAYLSWRWKQYVSPVYTLSEKPSGQTNTHTWPLKTINSIKHSVRHTLYGDCRVKLLPAHVWDWVLAHGCDNFHRLSEGCRHCLGVFKIG